MTSVLATRAALAPATQHIRQYYGYPPDTPKLLRSGDLLHSLTTLSLTEAARAGEVTVGTRLPAARILQDGGTLIDPRTNRERTVPSLGLHQVFFEDPSSVTIELNYPAAEAAAK